MRMTMLIFAFLSFNFLQANSEPATVNFFEGDFAEAKSKAGAEGKLFFVDFYATWCAPCKWMEESTFKDREVIQLLEENYVALKIDIDDLDGYAIKQQYQVRILPTILIFNSKGELVERVEETLSSRKMAYLLKFHNKDSNKEKHTHAFNSSPRQKMESYDSFKSRYNAVAKTNVSSTSVKKSYRIQLGVYKEFENTYNIVDTMKSKFIEPIIVLNDVRNGKVIYRVLMGEFQTESEANDFKEILARDFDIKGIVR